jgi:hypothetical protein
MPALSSVASKAETLRITAEMEAMKKRAARQAARTAVAEADIPMVEVTILPAGDGKVSMGEHFAALGDAHYEEGETANLQLPIAVSLYDRGYVNFEGAKQASAEAKEKRLQAIRERREAERRAREEMTDDE